MNDKLSGVYAMMLACAIWGSLNIVFAALKPMPAVDIVSHRVIWGMVALTLWLFWKSRFGEIISLLKDRRTMMRVGLCALLIALNWLGFVFAAQTGHALEASMGYFIFPLVTVAFGAIFKNEKLNFAQWVAVSVAFLAVCILTYGLRKPPLISLFLAITFALYGLVKSNASYGPTIGVALENIVLAPFAIIWLLLISNADVGFTTNIKYSVFLMITGTATAIALLSLSSATKILSMFMVGFLSYINPMLQSLNATVFLGEDFTKWHAMAFFLILAGSAFYIWDLWRRARNKHTI